jgi:cytochrome P450
MTQVLRIRDFSDDFNPFTALLNVGGEGDIIDPYPELARLRHIAPVHAIDLHSHLGAPKHVTIGDRPCYTVLAWNEVAHVLGTPADFSNRVYESDLGITFGKTITAMDPPEHTRYRRLIMGAFAPNVLEGYRPMFQAVIDRLIARFVDRGDGDLVQEFALHFPFQFIMDLMGMDEEQRPTYHKIAISASSSMSS